jgi:hypothetical protein
MVDVSVRRFLPVFDVEMRFLRQESFQSLISSSHVVKEAEQKPLMTGVFMPDKKN